MSAASRSGACLCGAIRFQLTGDIAPALHCHCEHCRRHTGNFVAASRVSDDDLAVDDEREVLRWHDLPFARYGFCGECGSTLFFKGSDTPDRTSVMLGAVDDTAGLDLSGVWFASEAQPHHVLSPLVPHHATNGDA